MKRGEIWWADLGEPRGSAPALVRPVLVVSNDRYNASRISTVMAIVLTRTLRLASLPGNVMLPADIAGLEFDSVANVTQVATVDRSALDRLAGGLPDWAVAKVNSGLALALGLRGT